MGHARGDVVLLAREHGREFTVALDELRILLAQRRRVVVVRRARIHADAQIVAAGVDGGVFQGRPAQLEHQALLRIGDGGLARRDTEEAGIEPVGVFQHAARGDEVRAAAQVGGDGRVDFVRGEVTDAFAAGEQVLPEAVEVGGAGRARGHADDRDARRRPARLGAPARGGVARGGELADGGAVVHVRHPEVGDAGVLEPGHEAQHEQRARTEVEQVLVVAERVHAEQLLPQRAAQSGEVGRVGRGRRGGRQRQRLAVDLAAGGGGQGLQHDEAHRHHVVGNAGAEVGAQHRGGLAAVDPVVQHEVGDELPARAGNVRRGDHGVAHGGVGHQREFDLARLDAEAVDLQLLVGTAEVGADPRGIAANQVAGAIPASGQAGHVGDESLGRAFRLSEVAMGERVAAQQQFAGVAVGRSAVVHIADREFDVRQRRADGRDLRPRARVAQELERGDHVAFGGAVVVVQGRLGQPLEQAADRGGDLQLFTGADDVGQVRGRFLGGGLRDHLQRDVGQEDALDALFDERAVEPGGIAPHGLGHQNERAAAREGGEDFLEMHVERQRCEQQRARGASEPRVGGVPADEVGQRRGPHRHALGPAGGSRGEEHVREVVLGRVRAGPGRCGFGQRGERAGEAREFGEGVGFAQHHARERVVEHRPQALGRVGEVQRHVGEAGVDDGEDRDDGVGRPGGRDADAVARRESAAGQPGRQVGHAAQQLRVGQRLRGRFQRDHGGRTPRSVMQHRTKRVGWNRRCWRMVVHDSGRAPGRDVEWIRPRSPAGEAMRFVNKSTFRAGRHAHRSWIDSHAVTYVRALFPDYVEAVCVSNPPNA